MIAVCITTYNHEAFIAQAIESVLQQVCDEPIRLYIGDDASTDNTQVVCEHIMSQDARIVYIRRENNMGLVSNTLDLYQRIVADGCEYIAMLDGDDYWIDPHKLQQQIDYLRANPQIGLVHTAAYEDRDGKIYETDSANKPTGDISLQYNFEGALHTNCTVLFRSSLLQQNEMDAIRRQHFLVLDYPLYGLFAQRTQFAYIYLYMAAWRKHHSVSQPATITPFLRYQYHYARCWKWLDQRYPGNFHFKWYKAVLWYLWQIFYALIHFCKIFFKKISLLFAQVIKKLYLCTRF